MLCPVSEVNICEYEMIDKVFVPFRIFAPWPLLGCQGRMEGSIVALERVAYTLVGHIATSLHCYIATLLHCYIATLLQCIVRLFERPLLRLQDTGGRTMEMISGNRHEPIWSPAWPSQPSMHWGFSYLGPHYESEIWGQTKGDTNNRPAHTTPEDDSSKRHQPIWSPAWPSQAGTPSMHWGFSSMGPYFGVTTVDRKIRTDQEIHQQKSSTNQRRLVY